MKAYRGSSFLPPIPNLGTKFRSGARLPLRPGKEPAVSTQTGSSVGTMFWRRDKSLALSGSKPRLTLIQNIQSWFYWLG